MNLPIANKTLGQHFLRDQNVITKITEDFAEASEVIVEVGPGPAVLTTHLADLKKPLKVIEKDERMVEYLEKVIPTENINFADALEFDYSTLFPDGEKIWLVSNLPYNVSTPLTIAFLKNPQIKWMTLMYQREVADKICPIDTREGKQMSSLMALIQTYFKVKLLIKVRPGAFQPPPKVESAVLSFERLEETALPLEEIPAFEKFLRVLYSQKRKQAGKVLKQYAQSEILKAAFIESNIPSTLRAEAFKLEDVQALYKAIKNQGKLK